MKQPPPLFFQFLFTVRKEKKKNSFLWLEIHSYQQSNLLRTVKILTVLRCERNESCVQVGSVTIVEFDIRHIRLWGLNCSYRKGYIKCVCESIYRVSAVSVFIVFEAVNKSIEHSVFCQLYK